MGLTLSFSDTKLVTDIVNSLLYLVLFKWFTRKLGSEQVVPGSTSGTLIPKNQVNDQKENNSFVSYSGYITLEQNRGQQTKR